MASNKAFATGFQKSDQKKRTNALKRQEKRAKKKREKAYRRARIASILECRQCLEPAIKRECCGSMFCDKCYYANEDCPWCKEPVNKKNAAIKRDTAGNAVKEDASQVPLCKVLGAYLLKLLTWGFLAGLCVALYENGVRTYPTMNNYSCQIVLSSSAGQVRAMLYICGDLIPRRTSPTP